MNGMPYTVESLFDSGTGKDWVRVGFFANFADAKRKAQNIWIRPTRVVSDEKVVVLDESETIGFIKSWSIEDEAGETHCAALWLEE